MKNAIILLLAFLTAGAVNGQSSYGVRTSIGVSLAANETTYAGEVFDYINHEVTYQGSNLVKSLGVFGQRKFGPLYVRGEATYTTFEQEYRVRSFIQFGQAPKTLQETYQFIDFNIMSGLTHKNVRLGVGPVAHILIDRTEPLDFISGYSETNRVLTWGFVTSVGFDAGRLSLDVRYENSFRRIGDHINYGNRDAGFEGRPHVVSLVAGFSF